MSSTTRNGTAWNQRANASRRFRTVGPGWSCFLRTARIPMRGVNGRRRTGIRFLFLHDWGTSIRSCRRSKTTSADTSCRLGFAEGGFCCCRDCQLRPSGEGTRCGRPTRSPTHARAEWTLLSTASHTPSVSGRSSRSPTGSDRSSHLVVALVHGLTDRPGRWRDRKTRALEEALDAVLGEIEVQAAQDARRRQDEQQAIMEREVNLRRLVLARVPHARVAITCCRFVMLCSSGEADNSTVQGRWAGALAML
ncbi:hypothetical protein BCL80_11613 [Streptomyces avidinii]|nr:hypothetical protein BCL80_11613 [Streptomyces avidinii]SNX80913.1 hypothetical protein SAMN05421860_11413 [Streptomyces microflavus]